MGYEKGERGGDVFMLTLLLRASYVCYSPFSFFVVGSLAMLLFARHSF